MFLPLIDEIKETLPTLEAEAPSPSEEPCSTETESAGEGASKPNAVDEERTEGEPFCLINPAHHY